MNRKALGVALATVLCAALPAPAPAADALEAVVETDAGAFVIALRKDLAPRHVRHFVSTARAHGYDGTLFHRLVPHAIIQGGDPLSRDSKRASLHGSGGLGVLKSEFSSEPMKRGRVAAVLRPRDPNSAGSQFFICLADQDALTGKFTIFGEVTQGMDVVDRMSDVPVLGERPRTPIVIRKVTVRGGGTP